MTDTLLHAYVPLVFWTGLGLLLVKFLPDSFPRFLGRSLYWVGVPVQIFTLARQTDFSAQVGLVPAIAILGLIIGICLASIALLFLERQAACADGEEPERTGNPWAIGSRRGSFMISSILGNTGFVGLAVTPNFIAEPFQGWIVLYSVSHNVIGTYGIGVLLASFYGRPQASNPWFTTLRDVLTVPSLWAFALGMLTRSIPFPWVIEDGLHYSLWVIIPAALLLMGIRLRQIKGWQGLKTGLIPASIKMIGLPLLVGCIATALHLSANPRLALVLMAGMPTAFAGLILAEEYELDRELIASSIVVTTSTLFLALPVWLVLFG
ncbi:MAG: AEC family transporter [Cyanobacteria bacterium J06638_20]